METQIKVKPWGREIWFAHNNKYAGKILELKKNHRFSLQYHKIKEETQYLYSGKVLFSYGMDQDNLTEIILKPGDKLDITPGMIHRAEALEDSQIFEVSTPELDDVVKITDDYGRSGKGNNEALDRQIAANQN